MIVDLDGATSEPSRRRHAFLLSGAAATLSLVVLAALLAPTSRTDTSPAAAPIASPTAAAAMIIATGSMWIRSDQVSQLRDVTATACAPGVGAGPPLHLVFDRAGQLIAAYTSGETGRFIPLPPGYGGAGRLTVPCDTPEVFAPRINRAR